MFDLYLKEVSHGIFVLNILYMLLVKFMVKL